MKRTVFKTIAWLLAALLTFGSLAVCTGESDDPTKHLPVTVFDGSSLLYSIVRSRASDDQVKAVADGLTEKLSELTSTDVKHGSDLLAKDESTKNSNPEILLGLTDRDESAAEHERLRYNDWSVTVTEYKILISAHLPENLQLAADWFVSKLTKGSDGKITLGEVCTHSSEDGISLEIDGAPVSDFVLVTAEKATEKEKEFAEKLRLEIAQKTNLVLKTVTDKTEKAEHEIIVGNTSRGTAKTVNEFGYSAEISDGSLYLNAGCTTAYDKLLSDIVTKYLKDKTKVTADSAISGEISSDLRFMSSNVCFTEDYDNEYRMHCLAETYLKYKPDVLCLQEARPELASMISSLVGSSYAAVPFTSSDRPLVYQQILYRSDLFELVDYGFTRFRENVIPWGVSWAVLKRISDGKQFCAMSTHYSIITDTYDPGEQNHVKGVELRKNDTDTILKVIEAVRNSYKGIPVILGGDFNANLGSNDLKALDSSEFMRNAIETADIYANKNTHTAHDFSVMPHNGTGMIDHIYTSTDTVTVLRQDLVADGVVIQGSDHCPVYADIILR